MKVTQVVIGYSEARSAHYQKAEYSMQITVELGSSTNDEGIVIQETVTEAVGKYKPALIQEVARVVGAQIAQIEAEEAAKR